MAVLYGQVRRHINDDTVTDCSYIYSCKLNLLRGGEILKNWTKADDEKLRLLDSYGVTVIDISEILGVTYNFAKSRLEKIITDKKEE